MDRIVQYNAQKINTPALESIIGAKRFAETTVNYTASGVDRTVDTSNWNYAIWLSLATAL